MPDIIVHASMGRKVKDRMGLELNEKAFSFGLLGPDPFLFCIPVVCHYSSIMHRFKTNEFLMELAKRCRSGEEFSYLCGFLCHFALDSLTHPLIVEMSQEKYGPTWKGSMMHIALEHRLDVMDGGKSIIPEFPPSSTMDFFYDSIKAVYGWEDAEKKLKHGYRCMPAFYLFVRDRYGLFDKVTGWTKGPPAMISGKSRICDGLDFSEFYPLYDQSIEDAQKYINSAQAFLEKKISAEDFSSTLGFVPYLKDKKNDTGYSTT